MITSDSTDLGLEIKLSDEWKAELWNWVMQFNVNKTLIYESKNVKSNLRLEIFMDSFYLVNKLLNWLCV